MTLALVPYQCDIRSRSRGPAVGTHISDKLSRSPSSLSFSFAVLHLAYLLPIDLQDVMVPFVRLVAPSLTS